MFNSSLTNSLPKPMRWLTMWVNLFCTSAIDSPCFLLNSSYSWIKPCFLAILTSMVPSYKRERLEKREEHKIFILVHSNLSYIQFVKATWAWLCTISKDLQSIHPYTFKIFKNTTKDSWITQETHQHNKNPLADLENHQAHTQSLRKIKLQCSTTQPTTNHFLQASNQAKSSKNWSKINLQLLQIVWSWRREFPQVFRTNFALKNDQQTFLSKITTFIVKLLRNSTGWFPNQSVDFTWLSKISRLKNKSIDWICCSLTHVIHQLRTSSHAISLKCEHKTYEPTRSYPYTRVTRYEPPRSDRHMFTTIH